jgi:hypothetical protein
LATLESLKAILDPYDIKIKISSINKEEIGDIGEDLIGVVL